MADDNDRVKTTIVGYREPHYPGEPRSNRAIHKLDDPRILVYCSQNYEPIPLR